MSRIEFANLFSLHAAVAFDKQQWLADVAGNSDDDWNVDLQSCAISFREWAWRISLLGSESVVTNTWLWAWSNEFSVIPRTLLSAAEFIRMQGEVLGIREFTQGKISLKEVCGDTLALIATSLWRANAYFQAPYEDGAVYVLIRDDAFPRCGDHPLARIATVFPQAICSLDIPNHRLALGGHLRYYGLQAQAEGDCMVVREENEPILIACFDADNRLTNFECNVVPKALFGRKASSDDEGGEKGTQLFSDEEKSCVPFSPFVRTKSGASSRKRSFSKSSPG